jgi:hypothetical protein
MFFEKSANFSAESWQKSQKIVNNIGPRLHDFFFFGQFFCKLFSRLTKNSQYRLCINFGKKKRRATFFKKASGTNPTAAIYKATNSVERYYRLNIDFPYCKKRSSLLQRWCCSCNFQSRRIGSWERCYDHNFLRFSTIFGEKIGVFLKNQCYDQNFA